MSDKHVIKVGFAGQLQDKTIELPPGEALPWDATSKLRRVGRAVARIDGHLKVSGQAKYTFDIALPDMLYAAVLRSPVPAAEVTKLNVDKAASQPGVKAAIAVAAVGDKVRFAGQDIAAVAATSPTLAREALAAIEVEYKSRPFVVETMPAARSDAPKVHSAAVKERRTEGDVPGDGAEAAKATGNVRRGRPMARGDVNKALSSPAFVHRATYTTQVQTHSALETHGLVVRWDGDDRMTVWASTQSIFSVRDEMAGIFELDKANVRVITEFVGGGFGAKFGAAAPGSRLGLIAGQLAKKARAPVKLMCTRPEEHVCTGNRPDSHQEVAVAGSSDKRLSAIHVQAHGTAGIGTGAGVGRNAIGIYTRCPNVLVDAADVFTNSGPGTAMRAPGHPQGAFALELAIDELAAKMGVDPLDLRRQHDEHPLRIHQFEVGAKRWDWKARRAESAQMRARKTRLRTGYGCAASIWGDFGRPKAAVATCTIGRDGSVEIKNGVQDIGGGIITILAQIGAEVLARPIDQITVRYGDSEFGPSIGSGGSMTTSTVTPAVRNACEQAKAQLTEVAARLMRVKPQQVQWDREGNATAGDKSKTFSQVCKKIDGEAIVATATRPRSYGRHPIALPGSSFTQIAGVQFAQVQVDTWTGIVRAQRILAIHDCGRVMNALTLRSQINGGVIGGTSYALMEQRIMAADLGRMLNANLEQYKILGAKDVPDIEVLITESHTGANNTGAAGIGEPATIPTAAAIACAVYDALGVPVRSLPLTPDRVLAALGAVPSQQGSQG